MWIFTQHGFYSINRTPDHSALQFRARRLKDLLNLKLAYPDLLSGTKITAWPTADYRWRLECPASTAAVVMAAMTEGIDYRNFKNHIATTDQADKLGILHDIWHQMHGYQDAQEHIERVAYLALSQSKPKKPAKKRK